MKHLPVVSFKTMVANKKLTTTDALDFLHLVKTKYQDNREIYDSFLTIMKDFRGQRAKTCDVISKVKELFKGQPELLLGFNTFLPTGFEITLSDDELTSNSKFAHFDEAYEFVNKVKTRFQNNDVFNSFLEVLKTHKKENKSVAELYQEVAILFQGHRDLLEEFHLFLPHYG
ncbi:F20P5.23 gene product [Arabidopsis thaliana]|uniref:Paired amphipathic helix (PAH2) superfamily protein n=5 Tax=Arabidopsis TaxID=3701 RepID=A0A654EMP4_ARATH|nr:F20P5.23 gene product [Arabidopsis thaliana]CAA0326989.1 unnamed protein product [Arabidopsis thaliana]VYS50567.1 unnamed protein product [Arabidopsis thaliana]